MGYDTERVDEMVLALLYLAKFQQGKHGMRARKSHDWDALGRLHNRGYISNPMGKAKSVAMTEEGAKRAEKLFRMHFASGSCTASQR